MIRILKEMNDSMDSFENISDEQIESIYNRQKIRIRNMVESKIDLILEKLSRYKDAITKGIINEYISSYYLQNDTLDIVGQDDLEERIEQIKEIIKLQNTSDDSLEIDINDFIEKILFEN